MPFRKPNKDITLLLIFIMNGWMLLASCESKEPDCYQPIEVRAICSFVKRDTSIVPVYINNDTSTYTLDTLFTFYDSAMNSPEMQVIGENPVFQVRGAEGSSVLGVPLNSSNDSIRYTFKTDTSATVFDTITFHYSPSVHFISNNCGYTYYFNIQNVTYTNHTIDSMVVNIPDVTDDITKRNVQFYFTKQF